MADPVSAYTRWKQPRVQDGRRQTQFGTPRDATRRKYGNIPTEYDGRMYASKLEAHHASILDLEKRAGLIRGWLPQVSLPIPGLKRRMIVDFLVVMPDGRIRLQDTKGTKPTRDWQIKRELIEKALGLSIDIVTRTRGR